MMTAARSEAWRRRCWLLIASFVVLGSLGRAFLTQSPEMGLSVLLVWGGALCCLEDQLPTLRVRPHPLALLLAVALLVVAQWRQERLIQPQRVMLVLPLLQGLGLLLLLRPQQGWRSLLDPLLVLALLPLQGVMEALVPVGALSRLTARLCQGLFLSFGVEASVVDHRLFLQGGGVSVAGSCSGVVMLAQLLLVGGIFCMVFPLVQGRWRWPVTVAVMAVAPLFALAANTLRIALLALFTVSGWPNWTWWFEFFHTGEGGLLFSLLAVMLFAPAYFSVQDRLLAPQPR